MTETKGFKKGQQRTAIFDTFGIFIMSLLMLLFKILSYYNMIIYKVTT